MAGHSISVHNAVQCLRPMHQRLTYCGFSLLQNKFNIDSWLVVKTEENEVRPENAPVLKGKCAREFVKKIERPLSPQQLKVFDDADKVFKAIKPRKKQTR